MGEALKIVNMMHRPEAKLDAKGNFVRNGRAAKKGLTKGILSVCWGKTWQYVKYKAPRVNKLVSDVKPHYSSQECSCCGRIHPDNRQTQAEFVCISCGFAANADWNAAMVLKKRAIKALLAGEIKPKKKREVGSLCKSRREPPNERVETTVNRADPQGDSALESLTGEPQGSDPAKREAPSR